MFIHVKLSNKECIFFFIEGLDLFWDIRIAIYFVKNDFHITYTVLII